MILYVIDIIIYRQSDPDTTVEKSLRFFHRFLYIKKFNASVIKPKSKVYDRFSINALLKESLIDIDDLFY